MIVTKLGAVRAADSLVAAGAHGQDDLIAGVHDNLTNLGLDALDVVNLRVGGMLGPTEGSIAEQGRGAGRPQAPGADPPRRPEQRHGRPGGRGAGDHRDRVRPEPLQPGQPQGRRVHRRPGPAGHPLRAVLPARRVHAAPVVHAVGRRGAARGHADAGRPGMAAAPLAQYPADPRHVVAGPPSREPGRGRADPAGGRPGGAGRDRRRQP